MKYFPTIMLVILFISFYFGMQYYSMFRLTGFFAKNYNLLIISLVLTLIYPVATIIDRLFHSIYTRIIYFFVSSLAGMLFILFFTLLILELINLITPIFNKQIIGIILLLFVFALSIFAIINATDITVKKINIDNFGKDLRIVQLSDVHIGTVRNSHFLNKIITKTNSLNPDIVVITGDFVDGSGKLSAETFVQLNGIKAPVYLVMGNHEFYEGEQKVIDFLSKTKVKVLRNEPELIKGINIIGLDYSENKSYVADHLKNIEFNKSKPTILLNHVPIGYDDAEKAGIKLQLSGHTHDGQIFPFTLLVKTRFPKINGLYNIGNMSLYVSPGTGTWGPPMRLGSKNEITVINLK
jgi:uncharacterized protein